MPAPERGNGNQPHFIAISALESARFGSCALFVINPKRTIHWSYWRKRKADIFYQRQALRRNARSKIFTQRAEVAEGRGGKKMISSSSYMRKNKFRF